MTTDLVIQSESQQSQQVSKKRTPIEDRIDLSSSESSEEDVEDEEGEEDVEDEEDERSYSPVDPVTGLPSVPGMGVESGSEEVEVEGSEEVEVEEQSASAPPPCRLTAKAIIAKVIAKASWRQAHQAMLVRPPSPVVAAADEEPPPPTTRYSPVSYVPPPSSSQPIAGGSRMSTAGRLQPSIQLAAASRPQPPPRRLSPRFDPEAVVVERLTFGKSDRWYLRATHSSR